ncbi:MAG: sulfotransferase family protein, partial [Rhodospirillaceae bacterium]
YARLFREWQEFTYDLTDLGQYARDYLELMAHWKAVLPADTIHDVAYENVVADLEGEARRLLAFCGLTWDAKVLEFYRTQRPVATASALQVRQPIYTTALKRAQPYAAHLGPLRQALGSA